MAIRNVKKSAVLKDRLKDRKSRKRDGARWGEMGRDGARWDETTGWLHNE
jgi:hypothetical protein